MRADPGEAAAVPQEAAPLRTERPARYAATGEAKQMVCEPEHEGLLVSGARQGRFHAQPGRIFGTGPSPLRKPSSVATNVTKRRNLRLERTSGLVHLEHHFLGEPARHLDGRSHRRPVSVMSESLDLERYILNGLAMQVRIRGPSKSEPRVPPPCIRRTRARFPCASRIADYPRRRNR